MGYDVGDDLGVCVCVFVFCFCTLRTWVCGPGRTAPGKIYNVDKNEKNVVKKAKWLARG